MFQLLAHLHMKNMAGNSSKMYGDAFNLLGAKLSD